MSAFSSYMRQNAYYRKLKSIFEDCCHIIVMQQMPIVEQFAREIRNLPLQAKKWI